MLYVFAHRYENNWTPILLSSFFTFPMKTKNADHEMDGAAKYAHLPNVTGPRVMAYGMTVLQFVGGLVAFIKAGSLMSLVAGLFFALWFLATARWLESTKLKIIKGGMWSGTICSLILGLVMMYRWLSTGSPIPLFVGISGLMTAFRFLINDVVNESAPQQL